jgi:hypothetical protein
MWNSNSVTSWLLARSVVVTAQIQPPHGGRPPGWDAGLGVAATHDLQRVEDRQTDKTAMAAGRH